MERKVGEKFSFDDITLEVVETMDCKGCYFNGMGLKCSYQIIRYIIGGCSQYSREDETNVIFKKVE